MKKLILLTPVFYLCVLKSYSQSGQLDPSFGNKGIVKTDMGALLEYSSLARQVLIEPGGSIYIVLDQAFVSKRFPDGSIDSSYGFDGYSKSVSLGNIYAGLQPDGKIVITGSYDDTSYAMARLDIDGLPDSTFGNNGIQPAALIPRAITIQGNGKITLAGYITNADNENYFALARYNTNGDPDSSFNETGQQVIDFGFKIPPENGEGDSIAIHNSIANTIAIQADGKIVAGGYVYTGIDNDFAIARFNTDGSPDSTFNNDGRHTTGIGSFDETGYSLAIQSNNKIILAGYTSSGTSNRFAVVRWNANGSLDDTFNGDGKQTADLGSDMQIGNSVAIQSNGKIVVAGYTLNGVDNDIAIARFNTDGTLDDTFDDDGKLTTDFTSSDEYAGSLIIQSDDKIVVAGYSYTYLSGNVKEQFVLTRYTINGTLDSSFDFDGKLVGHYNQGNTLFNSTTVQADGKILAAGATWNGKNFDFAVVRYDTKGNLDSTFSDDGKQTSDFGTLDNIANSIVVQNDGKILVAGTGNAQFSIARYNTDGSPDNTFDGDGKQIISMGFSDVLKSVALQSDGKIVVAGYTYTDPNFDSAYFAIARLNNNGSPDNTFSGDGKLLTNFDSSSSFAASVVIQTDGKIVVAGRAVLNGRNHFAIARYKPDGSFDPAFSDDGKQNNVFGTGGYYGTSVSIQSDGKIVVAGFNQTLGGLTSSFAVARYKTNGDIDSAFNDNGSQTISLGPNFNFGYAVAIKKDGKIAVGGTNDNYAIVLFNSDGTPDSTFGINGIQTTEVGIGNSSIQSIAFEDNKLYAAGLGQFPGTLGLVARYLLKSKTLVPPTVSIITPANNAVYLAGENISITAAAIDADGTISKVEFFNGNTLLYTTTDSAYLFKWEGVRLGNYTLTAKATDNDGLVSTSGPVHVSVVSNKLPTVHIINPADNQTFIKGVAIHLEASAADPDGKITRVEFYNGKTLLATERIAPYRFDWRITRLGNYTLTAKATDNRGVVSTSAPIKVSLIPNNAPSVSIISPANGKIFTAPVTGATIDLEAFAKDPDGRVVEVVFYEGTTLLKIEHKLPYTFQWQHVPAGTYTITAIAKDNLSAKTTSAPITITVESPGEVASRGASSMGIESITNDEIRLQLSPNPVKTILNINITGAKKHKQLTISVISSSGVTIKTIRTNNSMRNIPLDLSSLASGMYVIKLISGDKVVHRQFIKM